MKEGNARRPLLPEQIIINWKNARRPLLAEHGMKNEENARRPLLPEQANLYQMNEMHKDPFYQNGL